MQNSHPDAPSADTDATRRAGTRTSSGPIVLLMAGGGLGWSVANALARRFDDVVVIEEQPEPKLAIVRRRARLLGWPVAVGQVAWGLAIRLAEPLAARRREEIISGAKLEPTPDPRLEIHRVPSVNAEDCRTLLRKLEPSVIAVYGTRIIGSKTLAAVQVPFINYHAGINPKYRGQHPAYWALSNRDPEHAGVTIHLVDKGVDTGDVLYQARVEFLAQDNILTYQWVQLEAALPLLERALADALAGRLSPRRVHLPDAQYFPPTLWTYMWNGVVRGVW